MNADGSRALPEFKCKLCLDTGVMNIRAVRTAEKDALDSGCNEDIPDPITCTCKAATTTPKTGNIS